MMENPVQLVATVSMGLALSALQAHMNPELVQAHVKSALQATGVLKDQLSQPFVLYTTTAQQAQGLVSCVQTELKISKRD